MKTLTATLLIAFIFASSLLKAQITLQYTFDSTSTTNPYCTNIGNNDFKYVLVNPAQNSFSVYNMDMSPYMTNIQIPPTGDSIKNGFEVIYVTNYLFDCDSTTLEYAYENPNNIYKPFRIYRTDGTLLLQVDSANGPYCLGCWGGSVDEVPIINTSAGAKLFLQKYGAHNVPEMLVYTMCGNLPTSVYNFPGNGNYVKIYPNPSSMLLNFEITPPNNQEEFQLVVFDNTGKEYNRVDLAASQNKFSLDVSTYSVPQN